MKPSINNLEWNKKSLVVMTKLSSSALKGSRTPNLLIRSQVLYPIEP